MWVVAPEKNQSGASHSMTLHEPLRVRQTGERTYVLRGTPTDCVIMAVRHFMLDHPPDLVLSGINHGSNLAEDVTYSGTIAAAIEGTMLGIRSIAMSQVGGSLEEGKIHWETPLTHGPGLLARLLDAGWPKDIVININYPPCPPDAVAGIEVTRQGTARPGFLAHRPAQRPVGHAVLLVQLRASAVDDGAGQRSCRHRREAHFGDAAVPEPDARCDLPGVARGVRSARRPQARGGRRHPLSSPRAFIQRSAIRHRAAVVSTPRRP